MGAEFQASKRFSYDHIWSFTKLEVLIWPTLFLGIAVQEKKKTVSYSWFAML